MRGEIDGGGFVETNGGLNGIKTGLCPAENLNFFLSFSYSRRKRKKKNEEEKSRDLQFV